MNRSVSVVIPTYNDVEFLGEAIESCLAQTREVEVLVVDDGSSCDPTAVVSGFPAVSYVRRSHGGLSAARNTGLAASHGSLVVFLDADDRLLPNAVADLVACFEGNTGAGLVYGAYRTIDATRTIIREFPLRVADGDLYRALLPGNLIGMNGAVMYRRQVLVELGGFDEDLAACEDWEVYLRIARDHPFGWTEGLVAEYRQHPRNMSRSSARVLRAALKALEKHRDFAASLDARSARAGEFDAAAESWKQFYGSRHATKLKRALIERDISMRLLAETAAMLRLAPRQLIDGLRDNA